MIGVSLELAAWDLVLLAAASNLVKEFVIRRDRDYLFRRMPKPIARSKTRKAVAKRFKITARGKVLRSRSSRRHLLSTKNAKRRRRLGKATLVDKTDVARVKANLPFG